MLNREAFALSEINNLGLDNTLKPIKLALEDDFFLNNNLSRLDNGLEGSFFNFNIIDYDPLN